MASAVVVLKHETSTIRQRHNFISIDLTFGVCDYVREVTSPDKVDSSPMSGPDNHRYFSNFIRDMERIALLRRGGLVAKWIAYHLLDLLVAGSNTGGETFPTRRK